MAKVRLQQIRHSYNADAGEKTEYALQKINQVWEDGGAYALLGPSGCGKTTLLNIVSGLLHPTEGKVFFDNLDMTLTTPDQRNIAQIFQFPVVYDTMTVRDNLAFPLRNRKMEPFEIEERVKTVAEMLDLTALLDKRASGLTADGKQKISLGRGLVRSDVNIMMFDEPLTVIDPHLKWQLRSELKQLHRRVGFTMVYVTHDQTEALTFADKVAVMFEGEVVQFGTPEELFLRPNHTFVGHFIGSPGMNLLPCELDGGFPVFAGNRIKLAAPITQINSTKKIELGVRPEFIKIDENGFSIKVNRIDDVGRYRIVKAECLGQNFNVYVPEGLEIPTENLRVSFDPQHTHVYCDGWLQNEKEPA
jgi:glycerol transport system ATP-binding protein|tara:strand:- start:501 stop:1583 length:1083 start_codon:yes stop_codon:yes gene_type:complete